MKFLSTLWLFSTKSKSQNKPQWKLSKSFYRPGSDLELDPRLLVNNEMDINILGIYLVEIINLSTVEHEISGDFQILLKSILNYFLD